MRLVHYGAANLSVLDPKYHGTGAPGEERRRRLNRTDYLPRLYYYREHATPEWIVTAQASQRYEIDFPEGLLYNLEADALGIWGKVGNPTTWENAIYRAGYAGYYTAEAAALFVEVAT